jgi:arginase family enzyme
MDRLDLPFGGLVSFLRLPICLNLSDIDADIAVLGIPSDDVIGIDVVELNPALDLPSQATAFLTTQIAIEILAFSRSVKD